MFYARFQKNHGATQLHKLAQRVIQIATLLFQTAMCSVVLVCSSRLPILTPIVFSAVLIGLTGSLDWRNLLQLFVCTVVAFLIAFFGVYGVTGTTPDIIIASGLRLNVRTGLISALSTVPLILVPRRKNQARPALAKSVLLLAFPLVGFTVGAFCWNVTGLSSIGITCFGLFVYSWAGLFCLSAALR